MALTKNDMQALIIVTIAFAIGLVWCFSDLNKENNSAPCSRSYVARYGDQECQEYQQQRDEESDDRNCGFRPAC